MICKGCGKENEENSKFCYSCGYKLLNIQENIKNNEYYQKFTDIKFNENLDDNIMTNFIQNNVHYYLLKYKHMNGLNKTTSWNWASFFLGTYWLFYRKMYLYGVLSIIIPAILSIIPIVNLIAIFACPIFLGLYGNTIYLHHMNKKIEEIMHVDDNIRDMVIRNTGGVNIIVPIIFVLISGLASFIWFSSMFVYLFAY
ncbi:MAG: zinc ribbon domain-containing protein [Peptostreptococcaceae bacterium]